MGTMSWCWGSIKPCLFSGSLHPDEQGLHAAQDLRGPLASGDGRRTRKEPEADPSWDHCPGQRSGEADIDRNQSVSALDFTKVRLTQSGCDASSIVTCLPFDFLDALHGIWQDGNLRPNAFIFLRRDSEETSPAWKAVG